MAHTPGPWAIDREIWWENVGGDPVEKHGGLVVYPESDPLQDDDGLIIAHVNDRFDVEVGRANAHLIAAAPDLLEALEAVRQAFIDGPDEPTQAGDLVQMRKWAASLCANALAKARGET